MRPRLLVPLVATAMLVSGCGGGDDDGGDVRELLARAKTVLDTTTGVHVSLTSEDLPESGTALERAEGDAARPPAFRGTLRVRLGAVSTDIDVVSVRGTVYVKLPFTRGFERTDPARFGLSDPAALLADEGGVSDLLVVDESPEAAGEVRRDGKVLTRVRAELPGELMDDVLTAAATDQTFRGTFDIDAGSGELRRAVLVGPFFDADVDTTFTLVLDDYGQRVDIRAP